MDQHEFVAKCYARYAELGLEPGNPDDGVWQDAHYPAPDPEGDATIPLLFDDHLQQGLYQSEEYGRCCFWVGDAKRFLTHGPFVEGWFELWDLYDKWKGDNVKKLHEEKNEEGKSVHAISIGKKGGAATHKEKNEEGKSLHALKISALAHADKDKYGKSLLGKRNGEASFEAKKSKMTEEEISALFLAMSQKAHEDRDQDGKSVLGKKNGKRLNEIIHSDLNEEGKSKHALKCNEIIHSQKDDKGRSLVAMKTSSQKWLCLETGHISTPGPLARYQRARGIDPKRRIQLS